MKAESLFTKKIIGMIMGFTILGLLLLLLRENEGRVAAEEKLKDIQYKVTSMKSQKDDVILDLQTQVSVLQAKLQEAADNQAATLAQKKVEMDTLSAQMKDNSDKYEAAAKEKEDRIGKLESQSKEESARFDDLLKEKNSEISSLSAELQEASKKIAEQYKKIETLESKNIAGENKGKALQSELEKMRRQNAELLKSAEENNKQTVLD